MTRDLSNSTCSACDALRRQPWTDTAHIALERGPAQERPQGSAQIFTCKRCETRWERFRRKSGWTSASIWRTV